MTEEVQERVGPGEIGPRKEGPRPRGEVRGGTWDLAPGETEGGIPTWHWPHTTTVWVWPQADGTFEMRAGGSSPETNSVVKGEWNEFVRSFGGVLLAVTNQTNGSMTLTVE
jgi:hypothetical protein